MQGRYWLGTLYNYEIPTALPAGCIWFKGQQEICPETQRVHVQCVVGFPKHVRLVAVKRIIGGNGHWELCRSAAADEYVWKEATRVEGTQFEFGGKPMRRNVEKDWEAIRDAAIAGDFAAIPGDIFIRCYGNLTRIYADHATPRAIERTCNVYWGPTGTGKSRRAWEEAGNTAYSKDPRTKWWCGYRGQENVIIDEFRGTIDIAHMLRWLDRYPVCVEIKGASRPLEAKTIWITSNTDPRTWYPEIDQETIDALLRRLTITHFDRL